MISHGPCPPFGSIDEGHDQPERGQCVHKLLPAPQRDVLFQQNHCGMYRSGDAGVNWTEITKGLPSDFDFPLAVHPRDPNTIFVMPLKGAEFRCPPENKLPSSAAATRARRGRHWAWVFRRATPSSRSIEKAG